MSSTGSNIEELFRKQFSGFERQPSKGLWSKITRKLAIREFFRFQPGSLNIYYIGLVSLLTAGALFLLPRSDKPAQEPAQQEIFSVPPLGSTDHKPEIRQEVTPAGKKLSGEHNNYQVVPAEVSGEQKNKQGSDVRTDNPVSGNENNNTITDKPIATTTDTSPVRLSRDLTSDPEKLLVDRTYADFTSDKVTGCAPLTVAFRNTSKNARHFTWHFSDGAVSGEKDPVYIFDDPGEYKVYLEAVGSNGKDISPEKLIVVSARPEADFEINISGENFPSDPVLFHNYSVNATRFQWDFGDGTQAEDMNPVHYYKNSGEYAIKLTVWSEEGCTDSLIIINPFQNNSCDIRFPNAFSPNPNGPSNGYYTEGLTTNEVFHPVCKGVLEYRLRIYNRFGSLVFESKDVSIGWDGYINGTLAKPGVYVWKARGRFTNGESFMKFGNVTLVQKK